MPAGVNDVFNAAVCNTLGDTMFYGRGAGKLASAVVADVVEARDIYRKQVACGKSGEAKVADFDSQEGRFFVRVLKKARADVEKVFGAVVPCVLERFGRNSLLTEYEEAEFGNADLRIQG